METKKIILGLITLVIFASLLAPVLSFAREPIDPPDYCMIRHDLTFVHQHCVYNQDRCAETYFKCCLFNALFTVTDWFTFAIIALITIFVIVAALNFLFAQGEPEKINKARQMLIFAAIASVVAIFAGSFPAIVAFFF